MRTAKPQRLRKIVTIQWIRAIVEGDKILLQKSPTMGIISVHLNLNNSLNSLSARCRFRKMFDNSVTLKTFETEFSNCRDSNLKISKIFLPVIAISLLEKLLA